MQLSSFAGRAFDVAQLSAALDSHEHVWAFVENDEGWFRRGEAIRVRKWNERERDAIAIAAVNGRLTSVADASTAIGVVDEMMTENARFTLGTTALRAIVRAGVPSLFRSALRVLRPLSRAIDQVETTAPDEESHASQRALYGATEMLEDSEEDSNLSDLEELLVERWMPANADVLDVGCGTGREAIAFAARGFHVTAIDVSTAAANVARVRAARKFPAFRLRVLDGDLESLDLPINGFGAIFFASDVFPCVRTRDARIRMLQRAADLVRSGGRVLLQAMVAPHRVRGALLDAGCMAVARWRGAEFERGDRHVWRGPPPVRIFRHGFTSEEDIVSEIESAGLSFVSRCGSYVVAEKKPRAQMATSARASLWQETRAVLAALPRVDRIRNTHGPKPAAAALRSDAQNAPHRDARGRARLARAIELCDRIYPFGRGGCYRRALLEIALDSGAAREPLYLGLADPEGHAWLPRSWPADRYPAVFTV